MEQKIKAIIIGLVAILAVSLFVALQAYTAKQSIEKERNALKNENASLLKKVDDSLNESDRLRDRVNALSQDMDRAAQEKEELQNKFNLISKERDALVEKLKKQAQITKEEEVSVAAPLQDNYWAGILKAKTDLQLQLGSVRAELKNVQINNEELMREKSNLELEATGLNRENQDMKRQAEYNKKIMDSIAQELVRERNDKFQIENAFKEIKAENLVLRRQLKSLSSRKINLERKVVDLQAKSAELGNKFKEMEDLLKEKMSKIDQMKNELELKQAGVETTPEKKDFVELPPIVVRPQSAQEDTGAEGVPLTGKIIAINKENNFVIIDLGIESGIKVGDVFKVYRDLESIASVEVMQLRSSIAACDIKKEFKPVAVGDTVR